MGIANTMGGILLESKETVVLKTAWLDTPLGPMIAIADEEVLYLLEFVGRKDLEREIVRLRQKNQCAILPGSTPPLISIRSELEQYFAGKLKQFKTPLRMIGSLFQMRVWEELQKIPHGQTRSYLEIARAIGRPIASRAVARANSTNQLAIIIPCHRVINTSGAVGGYAGGVSKKEWLLDHEKGGGR